MTWICLTGSQIKGPVHGMYFAARMQHTNRLIYLILRKRLLFPPIWWEERTLTDTLNNLYNVQEVMFSFSSFPGGSIMSVPLKSPKTPLKRPSNL